MVTVLLFTAVPFSDVWMCRK